MCLFRAVPLFAIASLAAILCSCNCDPDTAASVSTEDVVDKYIQANGGEAVIRSIRTESIETETKSRCRKSLALVSMGKMLVQHPNRIFSVDTLFVGMGNGGPFNTLESWKDGRKECSILTVCAHLAGNKRETVTDRDTDRCLYEFPANILRYIIDHKKRFRWGQDAIVDSSPCYVLIEQDDAALYRFYIDKRSFTVRAYSTKSLQTRTKTTNDKNLGGKKNASFSMRDAKVYKLGDYRWTNGVRLPHTCTQSQFGKCDWISRVTKYEFDKEIDDAVFVPPARDEE